ncbi:hypothetical protein GCM10010393_40830 [Streptomyces gobitricini]|uniref:Uncharacterized protein n=1 Tax=Streptomyces gobitricini TaxID=68211 RepID=A0ABN3MMQ8_9ACTN
MGRDARTGASQDGLGRADRTVTAPAAYRVVDSRDAVDRDAVGRDAYREKNVGEKTFPTPPHPPVTHMGGVCPLGWIWGGLAGICSPRPTADMRQPSPGRPSRTRA